MSPPPPLMRPLLVHATSTSTWGGGGGGGSGGRGHMDTDGINVLGGWSFKTIEERPLRSRGGALSLELQAVREKTKSTRLV